jgi:hypothetical protein
LAGIVLPVFAQQTWQRTYGGTGSDWSYSVQQTSDGGYIVVGVTQSFGDSAQVYLIKIDASGGTLWTKTYGGTDYDGGFSVQQTSDGGFVITGWTQSFGAGHTDVYLVKTNAQGDTLWTRTYGGTGYDGGNSIQQTTDGGYIIAGAKQTGYYAVYLIKTDGSGDTLWTRTYGGTYSDDAWSVQQTSDGGYIVTGFTMSFGAGGMDVWLLKTDSLGDTLWTKTYGGSNDDAGNSVRQTTDGGYIIAGQTKSFGNGGEDLYLIKTNASGDTLWTKTYGGVENEEGWSVQQTSDGGYVIAGFTGSFGAGNHDVWLLKTNAVGDTLWTRTYGGTGDDNGRCVQSTADGGYIIAGWTNSIGAGSDDVYLIKTDSLGRSTGVEDKPSSRPTPSSLHLTVSPNPFTSFASVPGHSLDRFALYDISGRRMGTYKGNRIGEGLEAGVYFLKAESGGGKQVRIVKVR